MGAPRTTSIDEVEAVEAEEGRRHEVLGILAGAATMLLALALWSYDARGGDNWIGPVGGGLSSLLASAFGIAAWVLPAELLLASIRLFGRTRTLLGLATLASTLVIVLVGCAMLHLALGGQQVFGGHMPGGILGEVLGEVLRSLLGAAGAYVVGVSVLLITLVLRAPISLVELATRAWRAVARAGLAVAGGVRALWQAWQEARALERAERAVAEDPQPPRIIGTDSEGDVGEEDGDAVIFHDGEPDMDAVEGDEEGEEEPPPRKRRTSRKAGPRIIAPTPESQRQAIRPEETPTAPSASRPFVLPPTALLEQQQASKLRIDADTLRNNAALLVEKLAAYGVRGRVDEIHPGPVVTMYEFEPESGTKVSKIAGLADDLAMALAAQRVRIVAPIPGKARVGFELPNEVRETVHLREILEDDRWNRTKAHLPIALGRDIAGQPVYGDLAKMPHLLVAGATGSGKSVGINVILLSLLSKKTPDEVRLLMVDPKVVELAVFDKIPHMLLPVVTDMKKAALSLRWAVDEMERRYQLFADAGARNIQTYNERVQKVLDGEMPIDKLAPHRAGKVRAQGPNGEEMLLDPADEERPDALDAPPVKLPYVVVVVDEFADLMMVAAKDVEGAVARLAQKARAAGIHVILATQRPSVDVITGMIKANFPARMAFKVSQREDSKTILGRNGAEHLLGMGDMLMLPPGASDLKRVHCAFVSEDEVKSVCDFLRAQGKPVYDDEILKPRDDEDGSDAGGAQSDDPLYDRAVAVVAHAGYCSISHLQRQLGVGYNKAAKLVERMELEGVVGPPSGKAGGRREVLVQAL